MRTGDAEGRHRRRQTLSAVLALLLLGAAAAYGQPVESLRYAPDITIDLGATSVGAGVLANDDLSGAVSLVDVVNLPAAARVAAAHRFDNGNLMLVLDSAVGVPAGGGFVEARDVLTYDATMHTFMPSLEGATIGIPDGSRIDGISRLEDGTTLLSLDTSVDGFDDEDILRVDGPGLELYLDVSALGIDPALDLDGFDVEEGASVRVFMSFDGSGSVDGVAFDDEDVLVYDLTAQTWALAFDASASTPAWPANADLIAVDVKIEATPTPTASATPSATATDTFTATAPPATATGTAPATSTATSPPSSPTATETGVATATETRVPTTTETRVPTATETRVPTATETRVPTGIATRTATATAVETPTGPAGTATATATAGLPCPGDCNASGEVTINELITLVNIALGNQSVAACPAGDLDNNGAIAINEIVAAVGSAINGCPT